MGYCYCTGNYGENVECVVTELVVWAGRQRSCGCLPLTTCVLIPRKARRIRVHHKKASQKWMALKSYRSRMKVATGYGLEVSDSGMKYHWEG